MSLRLELESGKNAFFLGGKNRGDLLLDKVSVHFFIKAFISYNSLQSLSQMRRRFTSFILNDSTMLTKRELEPF